MLAPLVTMTPPSIDDPGLGALWDLLGVGRKFRALPRRDAFRLLRWGPMAVADLVSEFFQTELLRATVAARGIFGAFAGPWSAGTSLGVILQAATDSNAAGPATFVRGGMGALTQALAAAARGLRRRDPHGRGRRADRRPRTARATGVVLSTRRGDPGARRRLERRSRSATLLGLVDPVDLDPDFIQKIRNYRAMGAVAKVNLALSGLPEFSAAKAAGGDAKTVLAGRIHIGPDIDYLERAYDAAKYGDFSPHPYCDVTIPTIADPSLAPAGPARPVGHRPVRALQAQGRGRLECPARGAGRRGRRDARRLRPRPRRVWSCGRQVLTPVDLEETYGVTGGHILHGEAALDQLFTMRPLLDWAQYRTPVRGLYLCGSGTHPGGGVTGAPGFNASREIRKDLRG